MFGGFADRLQNELVRSFPHVGFPLCLFWELTLITIYFFTGLVTFRQGFMLRATLLSADMGAGWVEAFWRVWEHSTNSGSAEKSGKSTVKILLDRGANNPLAL